MRRSSAFLAGAAASAVLLAGCGNDEPPPRLPAETAGSASTSPSGPTTPSPTTSASPSTDPPSETSPAPTASAAPSPTTSPSPPSPPTPTATSATGTLQLNGADLGVTRLGAPYDRAVAAITEVLGAGTPITDRVFCIGSGRTTQWGEFRAVSKDGVLSGWTIDSDRLEAPSGVKVGTDVATLERVYGDRLERFGPNPDNGPTFSVAGVDFFGDLSSTGDDATVTSLYTGSCSGP